MTQETRRPMPGLPECLPTGFPHEGAAINAPGCLLHARSYNADSKRLAIAECAAEKWRALTMQIITPHDAPWGSRREEGLRAATWHRFATLPHALEARP